MRWDIYEVLTGQLIARTSNADLVDKCERHPSFLVMSLN